jgi:hypothetical protein
MAVEQETFQAFDKLVAASEVTPRRRHSLIFGLGVRICYLEATAISFLRPCEAVRNVVA